MHSYNILPIHVHLITSYILVVNNLDFCWCMEKNVMNLTMRNFDFFLNLYSINHAYKGTHGIFPRCHGAANRNPIIRFSTWYPRTLHTIWISLVPFAGCICTTTWHLRPIPDNVHHVLCVGYAVQCADLAHIKRCFISPLKFRGAHCNKWSNSNVF